MFRIKEYKNKLLRDRLKEIHDNNIVYDNIKIYDINLKCWIVNDYVIQDYKLQKEVSVKNELILYVYK